MIWDLKAFAENQKKKGRKPQKNYPALLKSEKKFSNGNFFLHYQSSFEKILRSIITYSRYNSVTKVTASIWLLIDA